MSVLNFALSVQKRVLNLLLLSACCAVAFMATTHAQTTSSQWLLSYEGQSSNRFIWDKRTRALIRDGVPQRMYDDLLSGLGGPPEPVHVRDQRYFSASACVSHYCPDKGFIWVDTQNGITVGAYFSGKTLTLGSKRLLPRDLPAVARQAIIAWLDDNDVQPETVRYIAGDDRTTELVAAHFSSPGKYEANVQGPSFDCAKARSEVEKKICNDVGLARQDLELAKLAKEIHHGVDTVGAQDQLRAMQRGWLKERDAVCQDLSELSACLAEQYAQQRDKLMHWLPTR